MTRAILIVGALFGITAASSAQTNVGAVGKGRTYYEGSLRFEFTHSRRFVDGHVTVDLYRSNRSDSADVEVRVITAHGSKRRGIWESTLDTTFFTSVHGFDRLFELALGLDSRFIGRDLEPNGNDGNTCIIQFGGGMTSVRFKVWSPDYDTKERGLDPFYELCKEFLKLGGLDPNRFIDP